MRDDVPVLNARSMFPRRHPSAWLALALGLASVPLGPPLGLPALLLARRVRRQIADNLGRFTGARSAAAAEVAAWSSCLLWSAAALIVAIAAQPRIAHFVAALGLLLAGVLLLRRVPRVLAGAVVLGSLGVAFLGVRLHEGIVRDRAIEQMNACETHYQAASTAWQTSVMEPARDAYRKAATTCTGPRASEVKIRLRDLDGRDERARQVEDAKARRYTATQEAESSADRRRSASRLHARFAAAEQTVAPRLVEARRHEHARRWDKASELLESIESELRPFRGTELDASPRLRALTSETQALTTSIEPGLSKLRARREADRLRKEAAEERRQADAARRRERAEAWSSNRVRCCDGTLSPSCTYGGSLRGCCSWHGGVC